jgi:hypothetical protein
VQPEGDEVNRFLVCVLLDWHAPNALYVKDVQVAGAGGVQACVRTGVPVQPAGDDDRRLLIRVPLDRHEPQVP